MDEKQPIVIEDSDPEDEMDESGSETDDVGPALLSLPIEVFQLIQRHMDVATFFISLLTCKHFIECATSRPLVLKHLHSLPGLGLGLSELSTEVRTVLGVPYLIQAIPIPRLTSNQRC